MKKYIFAAFSVSLLLGIAGCNTRPIQNVDQTPIAESSSGKTLPLSAVQKAITRGAASRGWTTKVTGTNVVQATLVARSHKVIVEIPFSQTAYSINYVDSENMKAADGKIHKKYNGWIANLRADIDRELDNAANK